MNMIFAVLIFFSLTADSWAAPGDVVLIGHYSNMKVTVDDDPHIVDGYSVALYRQGKILFGNIGVATGSAEPSQGRLYDIVFDPATRKLSFKAKYSGGWEYSDRTGPGGRESRELLEFSGTVTRKSLAGKMVLKDGYAPNRAVKKTYASMKKTKEDYKPESINEWNSFSFLDTKW